MPVSLVTGMLPTRMWAWRDGLLHMSFGMFLIVTYIGYAVLSQKCVSCVSSEETRIGMMVAPGR